jgi:hypothetical protein
MSNDSVNKVNLLRSLYTTKARESSTEELRVLKEIKSELVISNDLKSNESSPINSATHSPYFKDQVYYNKEVVYNSPEETKWREVKTAEQDLQDSRQAYLESNRRRLNIL